MSAMKPFENENAPLIVLGSTGSVGTQALDVAEQTGRPVDAICADRNVDALEAQARKFGVRACAMRDETAAAALKLRLADTGIRVYGGEQGILNMIEESPAPIALNSIMGEAGLMPTLTVLRCVKELALANKESLVVAGAIVTATAKQTGRTIRPVDSEHCAIAQCLRAGRPEEVKRLILTASGGPFFGKTRDQLRDVTPTMALAHPTWRMGAKITIDSATLMNKGFEMIEASYLFDVPIGAVGVVVHRESIIHSMVEYIDGSVIAQMAVPDMRLCIQYALTYPEKLPGLTPRLNLAAVGKLTFYDVDSAAFPSVDMARRAIRTGGVHPCIFNSANEKAVELFCEGRIRFVDIFTLIDKALSHFAPLDGEPELSDIVKADREAREFVESEAERMAK